MNKKKNKNCAELLLPLLTQLPLFITTVSRRTSTQQVVRVTFPPAWKWEPRLCFMGHYQPSKNLILGVGADKDLGAAWAAHAARPDDRCSTPLYSCDSDRAPGIADYQG